MRVASARRIKMKTLEEMLEVLRMIRKLSYEDEAERANEILDKNLKKQE